MEIPQTARRHLDQAVQVVHLDVVVGEADLGCLQPPDPPHLGAGPRGLRLGFPVGHV